EIAQSMGYLSVGLHVDPNDWQRPPADVIVQRSIEQVTDPNPDIRGHVILLHDSGGDRSETIAALPKLIDALRAKGYNFVTVSELAGLSRDQVMPPIPPGSFKRLIGVPVFTSLRWLGYLLTSLFFIAIWLGVARAVFLCGIALGNRRVADRRGLPRLPRPEAVSLALR